MNEFELIKRCLNKEKESWNIFVQKYSRLIYWAIRRQLSLSGFTFDEGDIANIFQEVFLSIIEGSKLAQVKEKKLLSGWLAMVASNKTVDFMRRKIRNGSLLVPDAAILKNDGAEQELFDSDLTQIIKNIIDTLPAKERIIISLNLLEERTHQEIAGVLGIPINTVSTIIARTKEKIKKELEKKGITDSATK